MTFYPNLPKHPLIKLSSVLITMRFLLESFLNLFPVNKLIFWSNQSSSTIIFFLFHMDFSFRFFRVDTSGYPPIPPTIK